MRSPIVSRSVVIAAALAYALLSARRLPAQQASRDTAREAPTVALATLDADPPLRIGQTLRTRSGPLRVVGRLRSVSGDTLRLGLTPLASLTSLTRAVQVTPTTRLAIRDGHASRARGAAMGAAAGVVTGVLLGATIVEAFHGDTRDVWTVSAVFLPYTIPAGAVAGALLPGWRWRDVRLTPRE